MSSKSNLIKCLVCKNSHISSIYRGPLRNGSWGNWTKESRAVFSCDNCSLAFLENTNYDPVFYQSEEYNKNYDDNASIKNILSRHRKDDHFHFDRIGPTFFEGKVVADIGARVGGFIDIAKPIAQKTIAVEPAKVYHSHLSLSHEVYSYVADLKNSGRKIDVITSFNVIEHVPDPLEFIGDLRDCLNHNGEILLITPNLDDILNKLIFEDFSRYFFRTAHLFYFNVKSIETLLRSMELKDISIEFIHKYPLDNMINWLKTRQIGDNEPIGLDTSAINDIYTEEIQNQGLSSHLLIRCGL